MQQLFSLIRKRHPRTSISLSGQKDAPKTRARNEAAAETSMAASKRKRSKSPSPEKENQRSLNTRESRRSSVHSQLTREEAAQVLLPRRLSRRLSSALNQTAPTPQPVTPKAPVVDLSIIETYSDSPDLLAADIKESPKEGGRRSKRLRQESTEVSTPVPSTSRNQSRENSVTRSISTRNRSRPQSVVKQPEPTTRTPRIKDPLIDSTHSTPVMKKPSAAAVKKPAKRNVGPAVWDSEQVESIRTLVMGRLSERVDPVDILGQEEHYRNLRQIMQAAVESNESNSALLVGNRGSGKTMLIRKILRELKHEYKGKKPFHVIQLNGLLHTDDRMALEEITRALNLKDQIDLPAFTSFPEAFLGVFSAMRQSQQGEIIPTIFIIEEFDLFTGHNKQALLYNLFDSVQSGKNAMCVVGLTCRQDILESFEKRVKSRFSHRISYFTPLSYELFLELIQQTLLIPDSDVGSTVDERCALEFNDGAMALVNDPAATKIFSRIYQLHANIRPVYKILMQSLFSLTAEHPILKSSWVYEAFIQQTVDSKSEQMRNLSLLELSLLIAMKRLKQQDTPQFNFEMIFDVYHEFASLHNLMFKKTVVFKAFENLVEMELVQFVDGFGKCPVEFRMARLYLLPEQVTEAVLKAGTLPFVVRRWGTENWV